MFLQQDGKSFSMTGKLVTLTAEYMSKLNEAQLMANQTLKSMIISKGTIGTNMGNAALASGQAQSQMSMITGIAGIVGGAVGIIGGLASMYGSSQELNDLSNIDKGGSSATLEGTRIEPSEVDVQMTDMNRASLEGTRNTPAGDPNAPNARLSDADKHLEQAKIDSKWAGWKSGTAFGQAGSALINGVGQVSTAPLQGGKAQADADLEKGRAASGMIDQASGSTEGMSGNMQQSFGNAGSWIERFLQLAISSSHAA